MSISERRTVVIRNEVVRKGVFNVTDASILRPHDTTDITQGTPLP